MDPSLFFFFFFFFVSTTITAPYRSIHMSSFTVYMHQLGDDHRCSQFLTRPLHSSSVQSFFSIHQHTPAFVASSSISCNRCFKVFSGIFQHGIVKGPRLQPDRRDPDRMSLLKQRQRYRRRSDNRQRSLRGRRQSARRRDSLVRLGGEIDLWCSRIQGSDGQRVLMIPSKYYQYSNVSDSMMEP